MYFRKQVTAILKDVYVVLFVGTKSSKLNNLEQTNLKIMLCIDQVFSQIRALKFVLIKAAVTMKYT